MITLQCKLTFENEKDRQELQKLTRRFSSCLRYAYNRLIEGHKRKELKKHLQKVFNLNSRYCDDAIFKAQSLINSCLERGQNPKKVIFGGRKLFEKLKKKHINGEQREKLKQKWEERRRGCLYSRGDKSKKGNLNTRIIPEKDGLKLRINSGKRNWIKANIKRTVNRENDKWIEFITKLIEAEKTREYFPYSVEIRQINGSLYAFISFEEQLPNEPIITKEEGIIGIDINANPFHLALATVKAEGNLEGYQKISLHKLINKTKNQREYISWQIAHQIVETAIIQDKAIAIERLKGLHKGKKADGNKKLRKIKQQWIYRGILEKIKAVAKREGVEVIEVNPEYTSVIGMLKYAPQHNIDKDISGAYVVARRALGYKEELPKNYKKLLQDKDFREYVMNKLEEEKQKTKDKLQKERNEYKQKPLRRRIKQLSRDIKLLKSLSSEPQTQEPVNQRKEQVRGWYYTSYKLWQVAKVALTIPVLGRSLPRDLSPLKPILVEGDWDRVVKGLVPVSWDRDEGDRRNTASWGVPVAVKAEYKYPSPKC
ncbi:MAG: transposase [Hydrogenothermus sp.]|nr:MAG: transposase [Hydrogenothermus sp.]